MRAIAAVDEAWGIGRDGRLLIRIPADQKQFREKTGGGVVILGRKTLQTFPKGEPLTDRVNVILTRNPEFAVKGENAVVVHNEQELDEALRPYAQDDVWVIGGESVYRLLLPKCTEAIITKIERRYEADAFFPDLSAAPAWRLAEEGEEQVYFDTTWHLERWTRITSTGN